MKALVLNGIAHHETPLDSISDEMVDELIQRGWHVSTILLRETDIAGCNGCFSCWQCTPGMCVIEDYGREVTGKVINSDLVVIVTPVRFGGYSYEAKKALDRMIPLALPFLTKIDGVTRHPMRYEKYPSFLVVGILPARDEIQEGIFRKLINRNALNFHSTTFTCEIVYGDDSISSTHEIISQLVDSLGEQ